MKIFLPSPVLENNLGMLGPKRDLLALLFSKGCLGNSFVSHLQHVGRQSRNTVWGVLGRSQ